MIGGYAWRSELGVRMVISRRTTHHKALTTRDFYSKDEESYECPACGQTGFGDLRAPRRWTA